MPGLVFGWSGEGGFSQGKACQDTLSLLHGTQSVPSEFLFLLLNCARWVPRGFGFFSAFDDCQVFPQKNDETRR